MIEDLKTEDLKNTKRTSDIDKDSIYKQEEIVVLVDNRKGNANQAIALAESLQRPYSLIQIEYNHFGRLPSSILGLCPIHIKTPSLKFFKDLPVPKVIISSGRRSASLALYLKKISKNQAKIVQIMRPGSNPEEFDMVILPQHDYLNKTLPNIIRIIGALSDVKKTLEEEIVDFKLFYPEIKKFIAVSIGGSSKNYNFSLEDSNVLLNTLQRITEQQCLSLFITFSRRTPHKTKELFKNNISWPNIIYDPAEGGQNPYPAVIGLADYIITTADSISMSSEAAATGTPLYIFCPEKFKSKKHLFFMQQLIDLDIARKLESDTTYLENYEYNALDEISRVTELVKNNLL